MKPNVIFAFFSLAFIGMVWAEPVIDQSNESVNAWFAYGKSGADYYWNAQSFTPAMPVLDAVEGYFYPNQSETGTFTVEIWRQTGGLPTNQTDPRLGAAPLATKTITSMVTGAQPNCWIKWTFDIPVDVSSYVNLSNSLLILWKTTNSDGWGVSPGYSNVNAYDAGCRYWIVGDTAQVPSVSGIWNRYTVQDMAFRTYGSYPRLPCGSADTVYKVADINKDCNVDFKDFAVMAMNWTNCTDPENSACNQFWLP